MKLISALFCLLIIYLPSVVVSQQAHVNKKDLNKEILERQASVNSAVFNNSPFVIETGRQNSSVIIEPEINTGLSGFYDYQSNGECKHYVNRYQNQVVHAIYMYSGDSLNILPSRRSGYSVSADEGASFTFAVNIPTFRSGYPSLTAKSDGSAVICNSYTTGPTVYGGLHFDVAPGAGSFLTTNFPGNILFPGCSKLSNNNIFVCGITHPDDSIFSMVFNTTSNTFGSVRRLDMPGISLAGMDLSYATGPSGKAMMVINTISDDGGNFGLNRIFAVFSSDNGVTWNSPSVLYNPSVISGDTVVPWMGIDAIYDGQGNYYVAFNSTNPAGDYSSAKLWVSKNGGTPNLVAQHSGTNGIPQAANSPLHSDAGLCTIDHPSLSLTQDGSCIYVAYSVQFQNDTLNGFNKCHIFISAAQVSTMAFTIPEQITLSGANSFDERYPSLNQVTPVLGGFATLYLVYQKDPQPGSCALGDNAPISRSTLIFRKATSLFCPGLPGIKNIGSEIPGSFMLYQNYPNPFNPSTRIRFDVPVNSFITVKVYDVLGKMIISIADNEQVNPGIKEIEMNASSLSSGIYFYSIEAKVNSKLAYVYTKRMVLIK